MASLSAPHASILTRSLPLGRVKPSLGSMVLGGFKGSWLAFHVGIVIGFLSTFYLLNGLLWPQPPGPESQTPHPDDDPFWVVQQLALLSAGHPHLSGGRCQRWGALGDGGILQGPWGAVAVRERGWRAVD